MRSVGGHRLGRYCGWRARGDCERHEKHYEILAESTFTMRFHILNLIKPDSKSFDLWQVFSFAAMSILPYMPLSCWFSMT
jgi:hypothetical protein